MAVSSVPKNVHTKYWLLKGPFMFFYNLSSNCRERLRQGGFSWSQSATSLLKVIQAGCLIFKNNYLHNGSRHNSSNMGNT